MARQVVGRVLASTHLDLHGEQLSEAELHTLFAQMPSSFVIDDEHDATRPPVARATNLQLKQLDDGHHAIVGDIEFFDDRELPPGSGFSIAFLPAGKGWIRDPNTEPEIEIHAHRLGWDEAIVTEIIDAFPEAVNVGVREMRRKGLLGTTAAVLIVVGQGILRGFFAEAGKDLYKAAKSMVLKHLPPGGVGAAGVVVQSSIQHNGKTVHLIMRMPGTTLADADQYGGLQAISALLNDIPPSLPTQTVCVEANPALRGWTLLYVTGPDGRAYSASQLGP